MRIERGSHFIAGAATVMALPAARNHDLGQEPMDPGFPAPLRVVDSITELGQADAGCIAVSGSHGGTSSGRFALAARPALTVFNDAGGGRDNAGLAALALLQRAGLAACTVSFTSARIGDASSSLNDGIVSHANHLAEQAGISCGQTCLQALQHFRRYAP